LTVVRMICLAVTISPGWYKTGSTCKTKQGMEKGFRMFWVEGEPSLLYLVWSLCAWTIAVFSKFDFILLYCPSTIKILLNKHIKVNRFLKECAEEENRIFDYHSILFGETDIIIECSIEDRWKWIRKKRKLPDGSTNRRAFP
jgi:hypothetical protein